MRALALVVLLACGVQAAEPPRSDAPVILDAGGVAPSRGLFLPEAKAIANEKAATACEAERAELKKSAGLAWWVPVLVGVVALGAGVSVGVVVGQEVQQR